MTKLRISETLALPESTITSTILVLGGKGMGKTNLDAVIAEEAAAARFRFSWIDPIGIAWSLQHGADRARPGLEVLVLGGVHGDIPIEPTAGAVVADLVVDHDVSVVLDISRRPDGRMWSHGEQIRFVADYAVRLYERQGERRRPLLQIFDEIGRFAPQHIPSGAIDIAKCLGALEQLVELGRNVGVGMLMSTQRNAKIAASIRELADALFAFRTVGPLSLKAVTDWLGEHVEKQRIAPIVQRIRSLPVGSALLISPGWLELEEVVPVRMRSTFDASATPTGAAARAPGKARKPDLEKYRALMAATIEKAEADDPRKLRARIRDLEAAVKKAADHSGSIPAPKTVEKPVLTEAQIKRIEQVVAHLERIATITVEALERQETQISAVRQVAADVSASLRSAVTATAAAPARERPTPAIAARPAPARAARPVDGPAGTEGITPRQQRFLDAAATLERLGVDATRETVAGWLGVHPRGGSVGEELGALAAAGLIEYDRRSIVVTDAGRASAGEISAGDAIARARGGLKPRQARIMDIIVGEYPKAIARAAIAERMGIHPGGGSFGEDLGALRGRGLVTYERGEVRARDFLFAGGG